MANKELTGLNLNDVIDYTEELENRLDNFNIYAEELEDKLNNAEKIIDKIDEIVFKTGSLTELEWKKIVKKYKNIEMANLAIKTLNTIVDELWYENDTVSDCIKEMCLENIGNFQNCLNLLLSEKSIEFDN